MGQRRETWVTWAGPGHVGGSGRALLVTARARQQLMYAGHRKAELRRRRSLWDLCVVLTWSLGCIPASSFTPFTHTDPRLYGRTRRLQHIATVVYRRLGCNPRVVRHFWCKNGEDLATLYECISDLSQEQFSHRAPVVLDTGNGQCEAEIVLSLL